MSTDKDIDKSESQSLAEIPDQSLPQISGEEAIFNVIGMVNQNYIVQKAKVIPAAFVLTQKVIKKIEEKSNDRLELLNTLEGDSIKFIGKVGYADLTERTFPSMSELLKNAGDENSPTDISFRWQAILAQPPLKIAVIDVKFHTNVRKETDSLNLLHFPIAHMEYEIGGVDNDWVEQTSNDLEPILKAIKLGGIYKPLLMFRNAALVHITSWAFGIMAQITTIQVLGRFFNSKSKSEMLNTILKTDDIAEKINKYVTYRMSDSSLFEPILVLGSGLLLTVIIIIAGLHFLPKLVPRSGILIGLEEVRYQVYENAFKFVVFGLLFGGIGVAIIIEIIKALF